MNIPYQLVDIAAPQEL